MIKSVGDGLSQKLYISRIEPNTWNTCCLRFGCWYTLSCQKPILVVEWTFHNELDWTCQSWISNCQSVLWQVRSPTIPFCPSVVLCRMPFDFLTLVISSSLVISYLLLLTVCLTSSFFFLFLKVLKVSKRSFIPLCFWRYVLFDFDVLEFEIL